MTEHHGSRESVVPFTGFALMIGLTLLALRVTYTGNSAIHLAWWAMLSGLCLAVALFFLWTALSGRQSPRPVGARTRDAGTRRARST